MPDRDNNPKKTPPAGVAAQIAGPLVETSDEHTDQHPTPVGLPTLDESIVEGIDRRVRETKNKAIDTLSGLEKLREDTSSKFDHVHRKIDGLSVVVSEVRATSSKAVGQNEGIIRQNDVIIKMLDAQNVAKAQSGEIRVVHETVTAEIHQAREKSLIEVEKEKELADIAVHKAKRSAIIEAVKEVGVKGIIAIGGVLGGAVAAGIGIERCGG